MLRFFKGKLDKSWDFGLEMGQNKLFDLLIKLNLFWMQDVFVFDVQYVVY